jgi:hypothetical protein
LKHGATTHPKILNLAESVMTRLSERSLSALPLPLCHTMAVGICERLWQYASAYVQAGDIGKLTKARIADAVGWPAEDADYIIEAMVNAGGPGRPGLLDRPGDHSTLRIHDWPEHAQDSVHAFLARARLYFCDGSAPHPRALKSVERPAAEAFYKANPTAPGTRKPRSRPPKAGKEAGTPPESVHNSERGPSAPDGGVGPQPEKRSHASPHPASPSLATPSPLPPSGPQRRVLVRTAPGGGDGGKAELSPEQVKARDALIRDPFPAVSFAKASSLAAEHKPWVIHAAIRRARKQVDEGKPVGGGLVVEWITSGDAEAREAPNRRRRAHAAWMMWPPMSRVNALADFSNNVRQLDDPGPQLPDDLLDFLADAIERDEARRAQQAPAGGGA